MARRVSEPLQSYPWLVCDLRGQIAGYAYATWHRVRGAYPWSVDKSVYIDTAYRRCGVVRGLYLSLFAILATQGYFSACAGIALHESMGFEKFGVYQRVGHKLGAWHDMGWWQLILKEHEGSPREPLDMATVWRHVGWETVLERGGSVIRAQAA